jgi:hypothetical protein
MKNLFGLVLLLTISLSSLTSIYAQGPDEYWIGLEEYAVHTNGDLEGMTTWRMYLHMLDADDYLSACTGSDSHPFILESTSSPAWYQHPSASVTFATGINSAFFTAFPDLEYDSWFTIGVEDASIDMDILSLADPAYDAFAAFEAGENIYSNTPVGNGWATLYPGLAGMGIVDENCDCVEVEASCLVDVNLNDLSDYFSAECANTDNPDALLYCALNETLLDAEFNGDADACAAITTWIEDNDWDGSGYGDELDCPILEMDLGDPCQDLSIPSQNPGFAGEDLRLLIGQITTAGTLSGSIYVQIFPWGVQDPDLRLLLPILYMPAQCMDENACNYDASAWTNDECEYGPSAGVIEGDQDINLNAGTTEWSYSCSDEASSFEWNITGGTILSGQGTSFVTVQWTTDGEISVTAISADGCPGISSTLEIDILMGLEGLTFSDNLTIFPSPASSNMTVSLDGVKGNNRCQIYSLTGKKVLAFVLENNTRTLDVSNLANGTYILAVDTDQGAVKQAFVIAK